jgi:hypothetical protein
MIRRLSGLGVAMALGFGGAAAHAQSVKVGDAAREIMAGEWFNLPGKGASPKLADFKGQIVMLEFWATW